MVATETDIIHTYSDSAVHGQKIDLIVIVLQLAIILLMN